MKSKRLLAVMLSGFMVLGSMTPVFAEELKGENTNDNVVVSEEQQGTDVNNSEEVKDNEKAVITDKYEQDKTAQDEKKSEESTSSNESSKTVKSTSKTAKAVVTNQTDEATGLTFSYDEDTKEATLTGNKNFSYTGETFKLPNEVNVAGSDEKYKVVNISSYAFSSGYFNSIKELIIPKNLKNWSADQNMSTFTNVEKITFEEGFEVKDLPRGAFNYMYKLKDITLPKSVETIGENAFAGCSALKSFDVEEGSVLKIIGKNAFDSDTALESITIPKTVETIKEGAFYKCTSLASCTFENDSAIKTMETAIFRDCSNLKTIIIPRSLEVLDGFNFSGIENITFEEGSKLKTISEQAFFNSKLKSIRIPRSVETISRNAFFLCEDLNSCTFEPGSALKTIGEYVFSRVGLESITIPKNITKISGRAIEQCPNLTTVDTEEGSALTTIDNNAIYFNPNFKTFKTTSTNTISIGSGFGEENSGAKIEGFTIVAHKGSADSPSSLYQYYLDNDPGSWVFKTEGICHGTTEVAGTKVEPTCTQAGSVTYTTGTCACGNEVSDEVTVVLPATGNHIFETVTDKPATCTVKGKEHKVCSGCGEIDYDSYKDTDMLAHKFDKEVVDKEATYTEEGSKHTECSVCGTKKEGSDVIIPKIVKEDDKNDNNNDNNVSGSSNNNPSNNGNSTSSGSTVTKTGSDKTAVNTPHISDEMNMVLYVLLGLVSLGAVGTVGYKLKKRNI
ncbi:leucine-rich repeat domain-containing protein [Anaerofustis stercorihominis]|uniref:leucine-rich repeat domain-containing protein n=1 Tax=Anaerofustis stercorihominis TaxID=214853 RepID=UPI00210A7802|nr:leucine-rich repeat domain-containing protein [Anaerofustis stercorihominis]MCQ4796412.1 leucine-rich repeat domain-containing protein [Anaerofustis stercorihominis]